MTVVCVADRLLASELNRRDITDLIVWEEGGPPPADVRQTRLFVPPYRLTAMTAEQLALMPELRVIQLLTAGADAWLDVRPTPVTLCSGQGIHGATTAELAVAGILHHVRDLARYERQRADGQWSPGERASVSGMRAAVIGAGDIGRKIADVLRIFGADVLLVARTAREGVVTLDELRSRLPEQDIVVIATPLTELTRGLVGRAFLSALPDQAIVVNVARGPIVDTDALLAELVTGRLRAALDVTDPEPLPAGHALWHAPGLLLTPHVGGGSAGWPVRAAELVERQLRHLRDGTALENIVAGA